MTYVFFKAYCLSGYSDLCVPFHRADDHSVTAKHDEQYAYNPNSLACITMDSLHYYIRKKMLAWLHQFQHKDDEDYEDPDDAQDGEKMETGEEMPPLFKPSDVEETGKFGNGKHRDGSSSSHEESKQDTPDG